MSATPREGGQTAQMGGAAPEPGGTTSQAGAKLAANGLDAQAPPPGGVQLPKRPERGEEIEVGIDSLAHGGEGVGRFGEAGYVVFVSGALPGDRVRAVVVKRKRSYAHARLVEILEESPERIAPVANHPGVAWQVLPYERQLQIKREQVEDALRRIGRLDGFAMEEIVPALAQWRYRNKLEYSFGIAAPTEPTGASGSAHGPSASTRGGSSESAGGTLQTHSPENSSKSEQVLLEAPEPGALVCGFHAPGGWKRVDPIDDCLLASEQGNRARKVALAWAREQGLRAWDRRRESLDSPVPLLRNLVVREGRHTGKLQVRLVSTDGELDVPSLAAALVAELGLDSGAPQGAHPKGHRHAGESVLSGVLWTRSSSLAETTAGGETELVWGEAELPERLAPRPLYVAGRQPHAASVADRSPYAPSAADRPPRIPSAVDLPRQTGLSGPELDLRISAEAFFQTNTEMAEVLYGIVAEYAALESWERVYDLYCGIGTIALTLAPRAGELWGIELVEPAVADAIAAAKRNDITNAHFFAGDTRLALPELVGRVGKPDVVVVDPPRAGLSQKVVRRIIEASPKRIVYVSCNPTTLAPNAAQLVEAGWRLVKVRPVDMFPQTPHIECVALLERV